MKHSAIFLIVLLCWVPLLRAQSEATAGRPLDLSTFIGLSGIDTRLDNGRNLGITAGLSLSFPRCRGWVPSAEVRGTAPVSQGNIVSEKGVAAGLQMAKPLGGRLLPFADLLFGRNQFSYLNGGLPVPQTNIVYTESASNFISPGLGVWVDVGSRFAVRADAQFEYLKTPVTTSGHLISVPITIGIAYHFPSTKHGHPYP